MILQTLVPVDFLEKLGINSEINVKGHVDTKYLYTRNLLKNKTLLWMVVCVCVWVGEVEKMTGFFLLHSRGVIDYIHWCHCCISSDAVVEKPNKV